MIRITLFDFNLKPDGAPLEAKLEWAGHDSVPEVVQKKKVAITTGDDVGAGTVTIPLFFLMQLMAQLQEADMKRQGGALVMPPKGIIVPGAN